MEKCSQGRSLTAVLYKIKRERERERERDRVPKDRPENTKQQASKHPTTQEHMESQPHQHFAPISTLPAAYTTLHTTFSIRPKSAETRGRPRLDKPVFGQGGVGG